MPATFENLARLNEAFSNFSGALTILKDDDAHRDDLARDVADAAAELETAKKLLADANEEYEESAEAADAAFRILEQAMADVLKPGDGQ